MRQVVLRPTVLGRRLSDALFEGSVKRRIGIEADRESDAQNGTVMVIDFSQQFPRVLDSVLIQVVKKTHSETGVDDLGQVVYRTINSLGQFR